MTVKKIINKMMVNNINFEPSYFYRLLKKFSETHNYLKNYLQKLNFFLYYLRSQNFALNFINIHKIICNYIFKKFGDQKNFKEHKSS